MCSSEHTKHLLSEWKFRKYNLLKSLCQLARKLKVHNGEVAIEAECFMHPRWPSCLSSSSWSALAKFCWFLVKKTTHYGCRCSQTAWKSKCSNDTTPTHICQCIRDHHSVEQSGNLKCILNCSCGGLNIKLICTFFSVLLIILKCK